MVSGLYEPRNQSEIELDFNQIKSHQFYKQILMKLNSCFNF